MSAEQLNKPEIEPYIEIAENLRSFYKSSILEQCVTQEIPVLESERQRLAGCQNDTEGTRQDLRCVIKAGSEFFCVADVLTIDQTSDGKPEILEGTVVTKHLPDSRAEIIGFINKGQAEIIIGRKYQADLSLTVSRDHFSMYQDNDGKILITDEYGATNKAEIFTAQPKSNNEMPNPNIIDPISKIEFWSAESKEVKDNLRHSLTLADENTNNSR